MVNPHRQEGEFRQRKPGIAVLTLLYLTLISGISPLHNFTSFEHMPWGVLLALAMGRMNFPALALWLLMIIIYLGSFLYYGITPSLDALSGLIQMLNFTAPLFFIRGNEEVIGKAAERVFWLYITVGVMQMLHLLTPAEPFMQLLISRFHGGPLEDWRGVSMLETEPARAGFQLLMLYIVATACHPGRAFAMTVTLVMAQFAMVFSTTGILLTAFYLGLTSAARMIKRSHRAHDVMILAVTGIGIILIASSQPKVGFLIQSWERDGVTGVYHALLVSSGGRFPATVNGLADVARWPFGRGANPPFIFREGAYADKFVAPGYGGYVDNAGFTTGVCADESAAAGCLRQIRRPVSALLHYLYYFGIFMLIPLWLAVRRNVPQVNLGTPFWALIAIGILYTPPGSEIWLMAVCTASQGRLVFRGAPQKAAFSLWARIRQCRHRS